MNIALGNQLENIAANEGAEAAKNYLTAQQAYQNGDTFGDWYKRAYGDNAYSLSSKFENIFSGRIDEARDKFNQWYNEAENAKKAQSDFEFSKLLSRDSYAAMVEGAEAAGLNPYALLASGGMSPANVSFSSSESNSLKSDKKNNGKGIAAIAVIIAALIKALS